MKSRIVKPVLTPKKKIKKIQKIDLRVDISANSESRQSAEIVLRV